MRIGILSRGPQLYSTKRLFEAGQQLGHRMQVIDHTNCTLLIKDDQPTVYFQGKSLHLLDAVIPRIGASVTSLGAAVIQQFELMGVFTPTPAEALLRARDKLRCLQQLSRAGIPVPKTMMLTHGQPPIPLVKALGGFPVVVKMLESTHGVGVALADTPITLHATVEAFIRLHNRVLLQEFIAESRGADRRVVVVDGQIIATMERQAQAGEFRSNLHRGATARKVALTKQERELVLKVVDLMALDVAGIDLLSSKRGPLVMEVNASPGLEGIERITSVNVANTIIRMIERRTATRAQSS